MHLFWDAHLPREAKDDLLHSGHCQPVPLSKMREFRADSMYEPEKVARLLIHGPTSGAASWLFIPIPAGSASTGVPRISLLTRCTGQSFLSISRVGCLLQAGDGETPGLS